MFDDDRRTLVIDVLAGQLLHVLLQHEVAQAHGARLGGVLV